MYGEKYIDLYILTYLLLFITSTATSDRGTEYTPEQNTGEDLIIEN